MVWFFTIVVPLVRPLLNIPKIALVEIFSAFFSFVPYTYLLINFESFVARATSPTPSDVFMGWATVLLVMGVVIRLIGPEMPLLVLIFMLYCIYGYIFPKPWTHPGFDVDFLMSKLFVEPEAALFGTITHVSLRYIVYFTILTGVLGVLGYGKTMADFFTSLLGRKSVNVGRVSVGLGMAMGMVSGSGAADTAFIASTLKPAFKEAGYNDLVAAGIAANAGTLAYITPPILGSVAFVMVELLGIPYTWVIIMSIGPALLYALSIFLYNEFYARVTGLETKITSTYSERVKLDIIKGLIAFSPPIIILILIFSGYTVRLAVSIAIGFAILLAILIKDMRINLRRLHIGLAEGMILLAPIGASIVIANVIMAVVVLTGLHTKVTLLLLEFIGSNLPLAILFAFAFSLLLGMGVPPLATYILASLLTAPVIIKLAVASGIPEEAAQLATHMFLFYMSMLADITPPVALSAFAASSVYGMDPIKVGIKAALVALPKYFYALSLTWSYWGTALLVLPVILTSANIINSIYFILTRYIFIVIGIVLTSIANAGGTSLNCKLRYSVRILLSIAGILIIIPTYIIAIIGLIIGVIILVLIYKFNQISCIRL